MGSPAVGKTFAATQLLFGHYSQGRPVKWIEPLGSGLPDTGLPLRGATPGLREKIQLLLKKLGLNPLDSAEFVSTNLKPDTWVLIEDPFGQTEDDFKISLHTYTDLFDLHRFVKDLSTSSARSSARIILTSRQGLFERWREDCEAQGKDLPPCRIIILSDESYKKLGDSRQPKARLALQLIKARDLTLAPTEDDESGLDSIANIIGYRCETPREVELVVDELSPPLTLDQAIEKFEGRRVGTLERTADHCRTDNDDERLFLWLLIALKSIRVNYAFSPVYVWLHVLLARPNDPAVLEARLRSHYRPVYSKRQGYHTTLYRPALAPVTDDDIEIEHQPSRKGFQIDEFSADEIIEIPHDQEKRTIKTRMDERDILEPAHSTVIDAVREEVRHHPKFLTELIQRLVDFQPSKEPRVKGEYNFKDLRGLLLRTLLSYSGSLEEEAESALSRFLYEEMKAVRSAGSPYHSLQAIESGIERVIQNWEQASSRIKNVIFQLCEDGHLSASDVCGLLAYRRDFPQDEAWRFYKIMFKDIVHGHRPYGGIVRRSPFEYLLYHIEALPKELKAVMDLLALDLSCLAPAMEKLATKLASGAGSVTPELDAIAEILPADVAKAISQYWRDSGNLVSPVAIMLCDCYAKFWHAIPLDWRSPIFTPAARANVEFQKFLFHALPPVLSDGQAPQELIDLLRDGLSHDDLEVRSQSAIFLNMYWYALTPVEHEALLKFFQNEPETESLVKVLSESGLATPASVALAQELLLRSDAAVSTRLLKLVLDKIAARRHSDELSGWLDREQATDEEMWQLAKDCAVKCGEWGRVAVWQKLGSKDGSPYQSVFGYPPLSEWEQESMPMKLAIIYRLFRKWNSWYKDKAKVQGDSVPPPLHVDAELIERVRKLIDSLDEDFILWVLIWIGHESHWWSGPFQPLVDFAFRDRGDKLKNAAQAGKDYESDHRNKDNRIVSSLDLFPAEGVA